MRLGTRPVVAAACIVGSAFFSAGAMADTHPTPEVPTAAQLAGLTPAQLSLYQSGAPVDIVLDPDTGDILSVAPAETGNTVDISIRAVCDSGDACYKTNKVPYADNGFHGSAGTYTGNWPYRSGYSAGDYSVSACWTTNCGPEITAGSSVVFSSDVTGTSFTIY